MENISSKVFYKNVFISKIVKNSLSKNLDELMKFCFYCFFLLLSNDLNRFFYYEQFLDHNEEHRIFLTT